MFKKQLLFESLATLVQKVLPAIDTKVKEAYYPSHLRDYPEINYSDKSPFPSISTYSTKTDITGYFRGYNDSKPSIDLADYEEYHIAFRELQLIKEFMDYYNFPYDSSLNMHETQTLIFIQNFIVAYYYKFGPAYDLSNAEILYGPLEEYFFAKDLYFDIGVPILFQTFEQDCFEISDSILIRKITDNVHKSKFKLRSYSPPISDPVISSATHELVLKNYSLKKPDNFYTLSTFGHPEIYPHPIFQKFFLALKIVTDNTSGYAQIIIHPNGWASSYHLDQEPLNGTSVKNYPGHFDDFFWNNTQFEHVSAVDMEAVKIFFNKILASTENKLEIALKRFYKSIMRQEEEDIIIDLIIALEILLSDKEKNEITHKLALRISALFSNYKPEMGKVMDVFKTVKKIYAYRSDVVHGNHSVKAAKEIKLTDQTTVKVVMIAKDYLREVIKIMIDHSKYLNPTEIDVLLLEGAQKK